MKFVGGPNRKLEHVRVLYTKALFKPRAFQEGNVPKYSVMIIFDKKDPKHMAHLKQLNADAMQVMNEHWPNPADQPRIPFVGSSWQNTIRDGDTATNKSGIPYLEKTPEIAGHWFIQPKNKDKPAVVKAGNGVWMEVTDPNEIYGGCYCDVGVNVYSYEVTDKGITIGLNGVMKVEDADRIGGGGSSSATDIFGTPAPMDSENSANYGGDPFGAGGGQQESSIQRQTVNVGGGQQQGDPFAGQQQGPGDDGPSF
jgi:hypothetical protein